jgi:SagB-type dehydrogenase family enzyme
VTLPGPRPSGESITDVMHGRRSARDLHRPVDLADLGTLLPQSLGPTSVVEAPEAGVVQALRSCPSAGGLYPIDTYLLAAGVAGLAAGIYHYNVLTAELESLPGAEPVADLLREGFFWQEFVASAAVAVLLVAVFERSTAKYGERGYRLALLDAGHAAQNLLLTARQLRLPAVAVGGFDDDLLAGALGLDGVAEAVVHTVVLGGRDD